MIIPFDLHTHCTLSFDGKSSAEDMVDRAIKLGIKYYALTDHIDLGDFPDPDFDLEATVNGAKEQLPALQQKYAGDFTLLYGVELGQAVQDKELTEKLLSENDYDFVIGSTHNIRGHEDFYFLDYKEADVPELLRLYFEELLETAEWGRFDVMGHITYPLRYITGDCGIEADLTRFGGIIDRILQALIKNGKGIEINTSGLRQKYGRMFPDADIVKRYRELGGKILTIGSDAHCTDDLGKGIAEGIAAAREAGFTEIAVFRKRKPLFIGI
ncbi:MAG: histidinol-phosphatase HisJ family protein [Ruminiclostridium sp.]|nr:histidinol-phosphatase HisJ family protein [Ruminiclostridium sp.]